MIKIYCFLNIFRKCVQFLSILGVGYLLGNAFPTFEVRLITDNALPIVKAEGCGPKCKDFDDKIVFSDEVQE